VPAVSEPKPRLCVYCGSSHGASPAYTSAARELGRAMVARDIDLVYGGGNVGLMGEVAAEVLEGGGRVTGIITEHLMDREVGHHGLSELRVVDGMSSRKQGMFEASDAFIALPGGVGTMEELFEVLCWRYLGLHPKPIGVLNVDGYFDHLIAFLDRAIADGFLRHHDWVVSDSVDELLDALLPDRLT
jgi:uncharacterized protein (TIGR00730 family)